MLTRPEASSRPVRRDTNLPHDPYALGAHSSELLKKRVMIAPVLVMWHYRVLNDAHFISWLAMREILLSEARMSQDPDLIGLRYGGTYKVADTPEKVSRYKTLWGFDSEAVSQNMHRLCSDTSFSPTLIQVELIDFVNGLKKFVAEAGDRHFGQEVLTAAATVQT